MHLSMSCMRVVSVAVLVAVAEYFLVVTILDVYAPHTVTSENQEHNHKARAPLPSAWTTIRPTSWEGTYKGHPFTCPEDFLDPSYLMFCNYEVENLSYEHGTFTFYINGTHPTTKQRSLLDKPSHTIRFIDGWDNSSVVHEYKLLVSKTVLDYSSCGVTITTPSFIFSPVGFDMDSHLLYDNLLPLYSTLQDTKVGNNTLFITTTPLPKNADALGIFSKEDSITLDSLNAFKKVCFKRAYFSFNKARSFYHQKVDPIAFSKEVQSFRDFVVLELGLGGITPQSSAVALVSSPHFSNAEELATSTPDTFLLNPSLNFEEKLRIVRGAEVLVAMAGIEWAAFLHTGATAVNLLPYGVANTHFLDETSSIARANNITYLEWECSTLQCSDIYINTTTSGLKPDARRMLVDSDYRAMWLDQNIRVPTSVYLEEVQKARKATSMWNGHCSSCASFPPSRSGEWCAEPTDELPAHVIFPYCTKDGGLRGHGTQVIVNM